MIASLPCTVPVNILLFPPFTSFFLSVPIEHVSFSLSVLSLRSFCFLLYFGYFHCVPFASFCLFDSCTAFLSFPSICQCFHCVPFASFYLSVLSLRSFCFLISISAFTAFLSLHSICRYFHCVPFASSCRFITFTAFLSLHSIFRCFHCCAADFSLLNLPKGKSLGRSKPATNS